MNESAQFKFSPEAVGHVLSDRRLAVPIYQRSYSWDEDEVGDFWDDLLSAFSDGSEYFIGNIVLSAEESDDSFTIIDGQQRLATTQIMYGAIRNIFEQRDDKKRAGIVQDKYIATPDLLTGEDVPRLRLNSDDSPFYRQLIVENADAGGIAELKGSHKLIRNSYEMLQLKMLSEAEKAGDDWVTLLNKWTMFLEKKVRIVVVDVPTEADAFLIFETLNDRGADLTIADLLKNYLFGKSGEELDTVRDAWVSALGALEMSAENSTFTSFIRHLWSSMHGATRERLLYKSIKERITTRVHAVDFGQNLRESSRLYAAILNSDHEIWSELGTITKKNVEALMRLDLEQMRPLLLALMQHFSPDELKKALRALVSWGVRGLIVGGIGGGKAEKAYCDGALKVRSGQVKTTSDLLDVLSPIIPTDEEFHASFSKARVTKSKLARYYLIALENTVRDEPEPELVPNEDEEQVNLEHILPKNPEPTEWPAFPDDEHRTWVNRMGNLVLLQKGPNDRIGNKPWAVKKPILQASQLALTRESAEEADWIKEAITRRQDRLADLAVNTWPRNW
jgi:hypothetical protein